MAVNTERSGMSNDVNFKPGIRAEVIADSVSPEGHRLTTMEVTGHRFILPEFNTHRVFSRNSASSRAIPFSKQVERVINHPAVPVSFPTEQRGMQGGGETDQPEQAQHEWLKARDEAVERATRLANIGIHKSVVNRLLEPFMWHTIIVSATDWDGFFEQRVSALAQPEIRVLAEEMLFAYNDSRPVGLDYGEWHLPYIDQEDIDNVQSYLSGIGPTSSERLYIGGVATILGQVSAARCARVSYLTHDGVRSIEKDLGLYQRLVTARPMHASPLEHVATPAGDSGNLGNFRGWHQLRHEVENVL